MAVNTAKPSIYTKFKEDKENDKHKHNLPDDL